MRNLIVLSQHLFLLSHRLTKQIIRSFCSEYFLTSFLKVCWSCLGNLTRGLLSHLSASQEKVKNVLSLKYLFKC